MQRIQGLAIAWRLLLGIGTVAGMLLMPVGQNAAADQARSLRGWRTVLGVDCSQLQALGIDKMMNLRAGRIRVGCGLEPGGSPGAVSPAPQAPSEAAPALPANVNLVAQGVDLFDTYPAVTQSESMVWSSDGNTIAVNYNDSGQGDDAGISVSTDGGVTFHRLASTPFNTGHGTNFGDPILVYNQKLGTWFAGDLATGCGGAGIGLWTSTDALTWSVGACAHNNTGSVSDDRESMWVDNTPTSPFYGRMYISFNNFNVGPSGNTGALQVVHSDDGVTWTAPVTLTPAFVRDLQLTGGPDGTVFIPAMKEFGGGLPSSGKRSNTMYRSTDGGVTFSGATATLTTNAATASGNAVLHFASVSGTVIAGMAIVDQNRNGLIPTGTTVLSTTSTTVTMSANATGAGVGSGDTIQFAPFFMGVASFGAPGDALCSNSSYFGMMNPIWRYMGLGQPGVGPNGVVHYAYAGKGVNSGDTGDIYYTRSIDNGLTWSTPIALNTDQAAGGNKSQWMPSLSVTASGDVHVKWYDRRNTTDGTNYEVWGRQSADNGVTWQADQPVSSVLITQPEQPDPNINSCYAGDYDYATAMGNTHYATWTDGRVQISGHNQQDVFFAAVQAATGTFTLAVSETGSGTVTSSPAGIACPGTCSAIFPAGTQAEFACPLGSASSIPCPSMQKVTLTATPASGASFTGWGGACGGSTATCTVAMTASQSVSAAFSTGTVTLSASVIGSSGGTVTSAPAGINCPGMCSAQFARGVQVSLTANPASGWNFTGWDGACRGKQRCTVTTKAAINVYAGFTPQQGLRRTGMPESAPK